jgi:two-component system sensor histidine kinase PilS (NtrC family)
MSSDAGLLRTDDQVFAVKGLIVFRLVVISFFLGAVLLFQHRFGSFSFPLPISMLIAATYLISIVYLLMLHSVHRHSLFLYTQLLLDVVIETAIIYSTGGLMSPFTFLYIFTIIASAIVLIRPASWVIASTSSILYGLLVNLEFYNLIHPLPLFSFAAVQTSQPFIFFTVLLHITSFYLVAFLSDYLAQRLRNLLMAYTTKSRDLTNLQAFHENVVANMGSGFLALDMEKTIISANQAAERILGRSVKNLIRQKLDTIFPSIKDQDILPDADGESGQIKKHEVAYLTQSGEEKFLTVTSSLFRVATDTVRGFIVVFQDITYIKKMEEAIGMAERLAAIGRIAAGLAHEIRNPLGSISGSIQMLSAKMKNELSPQKEKLMSIILRETDRLNGIIGRLLSSSSPAHKMVSNVSLARLINEAVMLFRNDTRYSNLVETITDLDDRLLAEADPESIKQVFWNLMINAAQAMPEGGAIFIKMAPVYNDGDTAGMCRIIFSDSGCGVPEENMTKIFEPFYTTKTDGTGLGLSTVLKIVKNHGGEVNVSNGDTCGAVFTIRLPIMPVALDGRRT